MTEPHAVRRSTLLAVLSALLVIAIVLGVDYLTYRDTERQQVVQQALRQVQSSAEVTSYMGMPITAHGEIVGRVKEDETGWQEARLTLPVR